MIRLTTLVLSLVIAVAVIGFLVGINDGVPKPDGLWGSGSGQEFRHDSEPKVLATSASKKTIPAVAYADVPDTSMGPTKAWQAAPQGLPQPPYDLFAKVQPNAAEKAASGKLRASRRAFNGAPPFIPHPSENTSDAACYACHSGGMKMAGLKASVMSHPFLGNCTQCHAPMAPTPFRDLDASVQSSFVGLPAPQQGKRAYQGAPPTIPHSRWMRDNCLACHGGANGWAGMESTHPWRTNCTQCHAPSATLDQGVSVQTVPMLPPLKISSE